MPSKYFADDLKDSLNHNSCGITLDDGKQVWVAARPLPYYHSFFKSLANRFKFAKDVFMGNADALYWHKQ